MTGQTPLYLASEGGHFEVGQSLLAAGSAKDQAEKAGQTPLYIASERSHIDVVHSLLAAGAANEQA